MRLSPAQAYVKAIADGNEVEEKRLGDLLNTYQKLEEAREAVDGLVLDAALRLASAGIPVFPIRPGLKTPLTVNGFKDATCDPAVIVGWWRKWPNANLGGPTGLTFDVVDIDGPEGMVSIYGGDSPLIDTLNVLGISFTSRDARQHIFIPPNPGRRNATKVLPGVDYRGLGGYVVLPPSFVTPDDGVGRRYRWFGGEPPLQALTGKG